MAKQSRVQTPQVGSGWLATKDHVGTKLMATQFQGHYLDPSIALRILTACSITHDLRVHIKKIQVFRYGRSSSER